MLNHTFSLYDPKEGHQIALLHIVFPISVLICTKSL